MKGRRLVEGTILIALGLILLCNTLGFLEWRVWLDASRFWPVALVIMGVLILLRRSVPWVLIVLMVALIGLSAVRIPLDFVGINPWDWHEPGSGMGREPLESGTFHMEEPLAEGIESAEVSIDLSAGNIEVSGGTANLIEGALDYIGAEPQVEYRRAASREVISIKGGLSGRRSGGAAPRWSLRLTESVPVSIAIDAGAGRADMDFSTVRLSALDVDSGAGQFRAVFGDHGLRTDVSIDTGAADITLVVPASVGMRLKVSSAATGGNLGSSGLAKSGEFWISDNFDTAKSTLDIRISSAVSRLNVERR